MKRYAVMVKDSADPYKAYMYTKCETKEEAINWCKEAANSKYRVVEKSYVRDRETKEIIFTA